MRLTTGRGDYDVHNRDVITGLWKRLTEREEPICHQCLEVRRQPSSRWVRGLLEDR